MSWEITGTSYGDGSNNPRPVLNASNLANLMLYENVDAKKLGMNLVSKDNQCDAIVFNVPRANAPLSPRLPHYTLVDKVLESALDVLAAGGQMRFSSSGGMLATPQLQRRIRPGEWPYGYQNVYGDPAIQHGGGDRYRYLNDRDGFSVPYQPMKNEKVPLDISLNEMCRYIFVK